VIPAPESCPCCGSTTPPQLRNSAIQDGFHRDRGTSCRWRVAWWSEATKNSLPTPRSSGRHEVDLQVLPHLNERGRGTTGFWDGCAQSPAKPTCVRGRRLFRRTLVEPQASEVSERIDISHGSRPPLRQLSPSAVDRALPRQGSTCSVGQSASLTDMLGASRRDPTSLGRLSAARFKFNGLLFAALLHPRAPLGPRLGRNADNPGPRHYYFGRAEPQVFKLVIGGDAEPLAFAELPDRLRAIVPGDNTHPLPQMAANGGSLLWNRFC